MVVKYKGYDQEQPATLNRPTLNRYPLLFPGTPIMARATKAQAKKALSRLFRKSSIHHPSLPEEFSSLPEEFYSSSFTSGRVPDMKTLLEEK